MKLWDRWVRGENLGLEKKVDEMIPNGSGVALDIGCGEGFYSKYLKKKGYFVIGLDKDTEMIKKFIKKYGTAIICDVERPLPILNDSAKIIICLDVLEHLNFPLSCIREIYEILKKNSLVIFKIPNGILDFHFLLENHKHLFTERSFEWMLYKFTILEKTKYAVLPLIRRVTRFPQFLCYKCKK